MQLRFSHPRIFNFILAIFIPSAALTGQWFLIPYAGAISHFLLFPAVFFVIFTLGFGPGLVSLFIASLGADYFFIEPIFEFKIFVTTASTIRFLLFFGFSIFTAIAIGRLKKDEQRLADQLAVKSGSEEKFQVMADSAPVMVWISDPKKLCTWFNKGWLDFAGRSLKDEIGNGWTDRIHADDFDRCLETYFENFDAKKEFYMECRMLHFSGLYRWISCKGVPRYDQQGNFEGYVGACMDIDEQKRAETNLVHTAEKLEQAVRVRDDFLSIASHELKTPLTSLKLQTQFVNRAIEKGELDAFSPERVKTMSERSEKQILRLTRLVDDMLDVSRISTGMLVIEKEEFDLSELTQDVIDRMQYQFLDSIGETPQIILCENSVGTWDRHRIDQVLVNLFSNAIRYGERKPIEVALSCNEESVTLAVRDHGIGISSENQERIFKRFERAVNSNEISGLGLGLFISAQIVSSHGGRLTVESELNAGSTFLMQLPKTSSAEPNHERQPLVE